MALHLPGVGYIDAMKESFLMAGKVTTLDFTLARDSMKLVGPDTFWTEGFYGGPFTPPSESYYISCNETEYGAVDWMAESGDSWLSVSPTDGIIVGDETAEVGVFPNALAEMFQPGEYKTGFTFMNLFTGSTRKRQVQLTVNEPLDVSPQQDLNCSGFLGGPFSPQSLVYSLINQGSLELDWSVQTDQAWLDAEPSKGSLAPGSDQLIVVSINSLANTLAPKDTNYNGTVIFRNKFTGGELTRQATLRVRNIATLPFSENFEAGLPLQSYWRISGTNTYRTQVTDAYEPFGGTKHLTMDNWSSIDQQNSRNEVTLTVDLAGYQKVLLKFWAREYADEPHRPPTNPFTGGADYDGVAISEDGNTWYEVLGLRDLTSYYNERVVDLDAAIRQYGLQYNSRFKIRFNHYDDDMIPTDGIALDDISITSDMPRVDDLTISPQEGYYCIADATTGPYFPSAKIYTLINSSSGALDWTADGENAEWLDVDSASGTLQEGQARDVTFSLNKSIREKDHGCYAGRLLFTSLLPDVSRTGSYSRDVLLRLGIPDYVTELFEDGDNDLAYRTITFDPNPEATQYHLCHDSLQISRFPTDPNGGIPLLLGDNTYAQITLTGSDRVNFFGKKYQYLFVSSNGYITLGTPDVEKEETFADHFQLPRISALFDDLDPSRPEAEVSWKRFADRIVVTFISVPEFDVDNRNNFQIEIYFKGRIRLSYLGLDTEDGLTGLSAGTGMPQGFIETDLTKTVTCGTGLLLLTQ